MLVVFNRLVALGVPFRFLIRVPATLADVVTSVLVFELVRRRRPLREAVVAGLVVASSPALVIISGYHGNTDPVFVMFALTSLYLLVTERSGVLAGLAFAAAISIKIVPIVVLPVLLLVAARSSRRRFVAFVAGSAALIVVSWGPVIVHRWTPFERNVLSYKGLNLPQWGILEFARIAGFSNHWQAILRNQGRFPLLLLSAGAPLLLVWRRPTAAVPAFGLSLVAVLLLSTSTAARYMVWAVAPVFLIDVWAGVVYNVAASVFLIVIYEGWNAGAWPWDWGRAQSQPWTPGEVFIGAIVWLALLAVAILALRRDDGLDVGSVVPTEETRQNAGPSPLPLEHTF
jgi:4-amino-4-deoxy-L-arabinose transferase-like glycosyltransferase